MQGQGLEPKLLTWMGQVGNWDPVLDAERKSHLVIQMWDFKGMVRQGLDPDVRLKHLGISPKGRWSLYAAALREQAMRPAGILAGGREAGLPPDRSPQGAGGGRASPGPGLPGPRMWVFAFSEVIGLEDSQGLMVKNQNTHLFLYTKNSKQCRYSVYRPAYFLFGDNLSGAERWSEAACGAWALSKGRYLVLVPRSHFCQQAILPHEQVLLPGLGHLLPCPWQETQHQDFPSPSFSSACITHHPLFLGQYFLRLASIFLA